MGLRGMDKKQKSINKETFAKLLSDDLANVTDIYNQLDEDELVQEMKHIIDSFWNVVLSEVEQGNIVKFHGKGQFMLKSRKGHIARNPHTGEPIPMKDYNSFLFEPSRRYRQRLRAQQEE